MLSLTDVAYRYDDGTHALAGVDLDVSPGELVALVGGNEAGKSTLLHLVAGAMAPTAGEVKTLDPVGWLLPAVDVGTTNAAAVAGCSFARVAQVDDWEGVLLADSPADATVDGLVVDSYHGALVEARHRGLTVLVTTHMADTVRLADRAVWLDRGQIRAEGPESISAATRDRVTLVASWSAHAGSVPPAHVTGAVAALIDPAAAAGWLVFQSAQHIPAEHTARVRWVVVEAPTQTRLRHRWDAVADRLAGRRVERRRRLLEDADLATVGGSAIGWDGDCRQVHIPTDAADPLPLTASWTSYGADHPLALTPEQCAEIVELAAALPVDVPNTATGRPGRWLQDHLPVPVGQHLTTVLNVANATFWQLDLHTVVVEALHYRTGAEFPAHTDWFPSSSNRKLAAVVPLTDDHDGGQLHVRAMGNWFAAPTDVGSVTVVPGWIEHRVSPVTAGERWSLVVWAYGPPLR